MRFPIALSASVAGLSLAACGSQPPSGSAPSAAPASAGTAACHVSGGAPSAATASYLMVAAVGPVEDMFNQGEASAHRGKGGEVMLGGSMADASGPGARHLEIHICSRATGEVVQAAEPAITVADITARSSPGPLPVATMRGVDSGPTDVHYGNNLLMPAGHIFAVTVSLAGETANLTVAPPS